MDVERVTEVALDRQNVGDLLIRGDQVASLRCANITFPILM